MIFSALSKFQTNGMSNILLSSVFRVLSLFSFVICLLPFTANAQFPEGQFLTDSIEIGRPFRFGFSFRHLPEVEVFFPDTTHDFSPFQVLSHEYFPTKTDARGSLDSAVYTLVSFEVAKTQVFKLPVWVMTARDCTAVYSLSDSIYLHELVKETSPTLQTDTAIVPLGRKINFPFILLIFSISALIGVTVYLFLGESIKRQWRLYQLFSRNQDFSRAFNRLVRSLTSKDSIESIEKAIVLWKQYLQRLEQKPFATYTTKEITDNLPDQDLSIALREIDSVIYGGVVASKTNTVESLEVLRKVATKMYRQRRVEVLQRRSPKESA
jgi:hypothetical protein